MGEKSLIIEKLEEFGDNSAKKINEYCLLHIAAAHGQHEILQLLLEHGADVNSNSDRNLTALFVAACELHLRAVQVLVNHGAHISGKDMFGVVVESGRSQQAGREVEVCDMLRYLKRHSEITNLGGHTLLHTAAENLHTDLIHFLVREFHQDVNAEDEDGRTPMHSVSAGLKFWKIEEWRGTNTARCLLQHGARLDVMNKWGKTPAQVADDLELKYLAGWLRSLQLLDVLSYSNSNTITYTDIYSCSDKFTETDSDTDAEIQGNTIEKETISVENKAGQRSGQRFLPRLLKLLNEDTNNNTEDQKTSKELEAFVTGNEAWQMSRTPDLLKKLIIAGKNTSLIKKLDEFEDEAAEKINECYLLHTATRHRQLHALVILVMYGGDIYHQDENNDIILYIAVRDLNLHAVKILMIFGANLRETNAAGWSVLHEVILASSEVRHRGREGEACEMLRWLADHGALNRGGGTINQIPTLLHFAAYALNTQLINFLVRDFKLDVNALDMAQQSPLYWISSGLDSLEADEVKGVNTARCLLEFGAKTKVVNRWNDTPGQYARAQGYEKLADFIEEFEEN